jgi:hypothetical protein
MALIQLIYVSQPFGFDDGMLNGILSDARRCNQRDDITGALICRADIYLQLLEGPEAAIDAAFARISKDDRHLDIVLLSRAWVTERLFPGWAMRDDPKHTWLWTQAEVAAGALTRATRPELLAVFKRMASNAGD